MKILLISIFFICTLSLYSQSFGICSSIDNAHMLKSAEAQYIEEGVQRFLVPQSDESEFIANLAKLNASPLKIYSCNSFLPGTIKLIGEDADHDAAITFAQTAFRRAKIAGVKVIVFGSGQSRMIDEGFSYERATEQFISLLKRMAPIARKYGVTVAIEPLNRTETNFLNSVTEGVEIVKKVGSKNIRCLCDVYHMKREGEMPASIIASKGYIAHVHVAELEGRAAPGTHNEDLTPYYKALKQIRYKGGISVEGRWDDMPVQASKAISTMKMQYNQD